MPEIVLPRRLGAVAQACDWIEAAMQSHGWSAGDVTRAVLSVGECVSNAVEHGGAPGVGPLRLSHETSADRASVWVVDGGSGPPRDRTANPSLPADPLATGGRGLFILDRLADRVEVDAHGGVCLTFWPRP